VLGYSTDTFPVTKYESSWLHDAEIPVIVGSVTTCWAAAA
jgi:hypothetical protein